ncbi:penicillin-binding protein activator [Pseudidiomarina sp. CB1]|uniref:penicillin-binding protein activator n=1 Tax=Pseudidiomarina sp. CB1 TaxID=2972484 RepID=UPI0021627394|nr:penicillin-binding protein activator [Pseudidiomarina sp. CB1]
MLTACATQQSKRPSTPVTPTEPPSEIGQTEVQSSARNIAQLLDEVQQLPSRELQLAFMVQESLRLQANNEWQSSAALLSQVERELKDHPTALDAAQQRRFTIAQAQWLASQGQFMAAQNTLRPLLDDLSRLSDSDRSLAMRLARDLAWQLGDEQHAASYALALLDADVAPDDSNEPWLYLRHAPKPSALTANSRLAQGWLRLAQAAHAIVDGSESAALQNWELRYANHPGLAVAAQLKQTLIASKRAQRALVLLPLSGQYAEQGQAVLDGMVMALEGQQDFEIIIQDSQGYDFRQLGEVIQRQQVTSVIGPLLKENLSQITPESVANVDWIALNSLERFTTPPTLWYALEPETEYSQIARTFAKRGYQRALVLAAESQRGQQAITAFQEAFLDAVPDGAVDTGVYRTPDDMKAIVQEKLGVTDSEERIWQVKITAGKILVDAEARSRADIDAIFLPGGIEQTRLLKPFIDVNISPFMDTIPVYATSASHIRRDALSENDLDNVRFTELPWLLPKHPAYERLQALLQQRRHWSYDLARLAAFGHDVMLLTQHRQQLKSLPGLSLDGLTGKLHWSGTQVYRELAWAQYDGHQVKPVDEVTAD